MGGDQACEDRSIQVTIGSITTDEPSLHGTGSLTATETSPGIVALGNIEGSGGGDPSGSMNAADVTISNGTVAVDVEAGIPNGSLDLDVSGEDQTLSVTMTMEPDGAGGYRVHFMGDGLDFTIP